MLIRSTGITLMILLHLFAKWGFSQSSQQEQDKYYDDICEIENSFTSPYVKAFYKIPTELKTSCCEKEGEKDQEGKEERKGNDDDDIEMHATSYAQELHLISIQSTSRHPSFNRRKMNLKIKPMKAIPEKLIFVLLSREPVLWKIQFESPEEHAVDIEFWITNNSSVIPDTQLKMKVNYLEWNSTDSMELFLDWISQRLGAITTMTESPPAKTITRTVGIVEDGLNCCPSDPHPLLSKDIRGCLIQWNKKQNRNKDVHILELHRNSENDEEKSLFKSVVIDIHPKTHSKPTLRKHILLVLKSHDATTQWKIRTKGLRGTLDIVTDRIVDTNDIEMQSIRVVNERLSLLSAIDLIVWTKEKYGEPVSYSDVQLANVFDLTVDMPGGGGEARIGLGQGQEVECHEKKIVTSLSKRHHLRRLNVRHFSLLDSSCKARENETHFYFTTSFDECGTERRRNKNEIVYRNAIMIRLTKSGGHLPTDHSGEGGYDSSAFDRSSRDDENEKQDLPGIIRLDFHCSYRVIHTESEVDFDLKLYKDSEFQKEIFHFPYIVQENEKLYIDASIAAHPSLNVVIDNCTALSLQEPLRIHTLITNGCPVEKTVKWVESDFTTGQSQQSERFEFVFGQFPEFSGGVKLKCDLSVCLKLPHGNRRHWCRSKEERCVVSKSFEGHDSGSRSRSTVILSKDSKSFGPLIVERSSTSGANYHLQTNHNGTSQVLIEEQKMAAVLTNDVIGVGSECDETIEVEGLNSAAVVGIAFAAFTIGVLLTGTLWLIDSRTGHLKKHAKGLRSAETSGDSTPSSTVPMAVRQSHHHKHIQHHRHGV